VAPGRQAQRNGAALSRIRREYLPTTVEGFEHETGVPAGGRSGVSLWGKVSEGEAEDERIVQRQLAYLPRRHLHAP